MAGAADNVRDPRRFARGDENNLTNLQTASPRWPDPTGALTAQAATSSQPGVVSATAQSSAIAGTHQIEVTSLATTGTLYTDPIAAGADTSFLASGQTSGDIQLQVGGASGTTHDIPITQGSNDTLNTLASYINTQSTANGWGVTASVVSDASGSRLALFSQNSGSTGALAIVNNSNTTLTFDTPVGGTNAVLTIDGVPFSSSSNTVTGAIQGVTLNLVSQSPGNPVQLTVGPDTKPDHERHQQLRLRLQHRGQHHQHAIRRGPNRRHARASSGIGYFLALAAVQHADGRGLRNWRQQRIRQPGLDGH